jgi:hypothetical protein
LFEFAIVFLNVFLADAIAQNCFLITIEILAPFHPVPSFRPPFDPCDVWVGAVSVGGLSGVKFYRRLFEAAICAHIPVDAISSIGFGCLPILATAEGRRASFVTVLRHIPPLRTLISDSITVINSSMTNPFAVISAPDVAAAIRFLAAICDENSMAFGSG